MMYGTEIVQNIPRRRRNKKGICLHTNVSTSPKIWTV